MTPLSVSETVKPGAVTLLGELGAVTTGAGGGTVSRIHVTVVVEVFPAASVAVTTRV